MATFTEAPPLAGAVELSGVLGTLYENYAPGYGFTAVAVALLGRLNPYGIIASALFFGVLTAGAGRCRRDRASQSTSCCLTDRPGVRYNSSFNLSPKI